MKTLAIISRKGGTGKPSWQSTWPQPFSTSTRRRAPRYGATGEPANRLQSSQRRPPRLAALLGQARQQKAGLVLLDTAPHADSIASEAAEPDRQPAGTAKAAPHNAPQSATPRLKQVGARIPEDLYRQLKSIAALKGESVRTILEAMIADYLHQHQQKV